MQPQKAGRVWTIRASGGPTVAVRVPRYRRRERRGDGNTGNDSEGRHPVLKT